MRRRLNRVGTSTLTVSLPAKWLRHYGLSKGDEIELSIEEGRIVLTPFSKPSLKRREFEVTLPERNVTRAMLNAYRQGVDEIQLRFSQPEVMGVIEKWKEMMFGFDVVEKGERYCTLKNIAMLDQSQFEDSLRRIFHILNEMARGSFEALGEGRYSELKSIAYLETMQNKLYMICCRIINTESFKKFKYPGAMLLLIRGLENVADHFRDICNYSLETKPHLSPEVTGLYQSAIEMVGLLQSFYHNPKPETSERIVELNNEVLKAIPRIFSSAQESEAPIVHYLLSAVRAGYDAASAIHDLNI